MDQAQAGDVLAAADRQRVARTAVALIEVPSPTLEAGAVAERLAGMLAEEGFAVERPAADWPQSPAVVARLDSGHPGRLLQWSGHLDTVHLPFVPPRTDGTRIWGSGAADMKGGIAACVEALRLLRDTGALQQGAVLLTAYDHHEGPWGDKRQLQALLRAGIHGDAVLLPEYLCDRLPVAGRGMAIYTARLCRDGEPVHEVLRPAGQPDVLRAGAELVVRLGELDQSLEGRTAPHAGRDSVFVGQVCGGEIYNQSPVECRVVGTRRWVTPGSAEAVRAELAGLVEGVAQEYGARGELEVRIQADAFAVDPSDPLVAAFQAAHMRVAGVALPLGGKPFVDDGNHFSSLAHVPALTHGPAATGAHSLEEVVPIDELVRVARVYALTALEYCR
ncbi:MAG: M20/M25/M40 family metallo-hydrolase [Candidatus Latescibacterota bacterium]